MPEFTSHEPGTFCWVELATSDPQGAKTFYTGLFGWTFNEFPMGEQGMYCIFQKNGRDAAAMYQQGPEQQGIPPNWMSYVSVASADDAVAKAKSLGATAMMEPFDVYDFGRMAVLADPQGAVFSLWQAMKNIGVQIRDENDTLCWNELQARDLDAAKKFYPALFGWTLKGSPEYTEISLGKRGIGGMMESKAPPGAPSFWLPYFLVENCDATVEKASASGGVAHVPGTDIPNVGRFAVLMDPQGAGFAIIQMQPSHGE